jgi:hypothetical protein
MCSYPIPAIYLALLLQFFMQLLQETMVLVSGKENYNALSRLHDTQSRFSSPRFVMYLLSTISPINIGLLSFAPYLRAAAQGTESHRTFERGEPRRTLAISVFVLPKYWEYTCLPKNDQADLPQAFEEAIACQETGSLSHPCCQPF